MRNRPLLELATYCQSPNTAWTSASAAIGAVSARRMRGPKAIRTTIGRLRSSHPLLLGKPAFRTNQDSKRLALGHVARRRAPSPDRSPRHSHRKRSASGRPHRRYLIESASVRRPPALQEYRIARPPQCIGAHAIEIDARNLRMPRHDRLQQRRTHLHRLLHEIVEACVLERREQKMQIAGALVCARSCGPTIRLTATACRFQTRLARHSPSRTVEQQHRVAMPQAEAHSADSLPGPD